LKENPNNQKNSVENTEEIKDVDIEQKDEGVKPEKGLTLADQLEKLKTEYNDLNNKYLRSLAEYDNFRKRTAREKEKIFQDSVAFVVKGFLDILDNFQNALKCETADTEFKKGFDMILINFNETLSKLGVEEIKTEGESFSPLFHNAIVHIEDSNYGDGQIVETLQKGYKIGDNVIRYAMVKVAN
jgi:molecular chaperone GrpE